MEDEDDLMDELNELEAEMAEDELAALEIGSDPIRGGAQVEPVAGKAQHNKAQMNEEDELKALERMMAI